MRRLFLQLIILSAFLALTACTLPLPPRPTPPSDCDNVKLSEVVTADKCAPQITREEASLNDIYYCAERCDPHAMARLGEVYLNGEYCKPKDLCKAVYWFRKAADCGLAYAQVQMGHFYRDGMGVRKNVQQAICWYRAAANQGDITGMLALGDLYRKGWYGVKADYAQSLDWYYRAAGLGSYEAEYRMAWIIIRQGPNNKFKFRNPDLAYELINDAARKGNPQALSDLGDLYAQGWCGPKDLKRAREYYEKAYLRGSVEAAFKLGMLYDAGDGVPKNRAEAARWFMIAAEKGYPPAEYHLGNLYRDGWGVHRDYSQAFYWYTKAVQDGITAAEVELGDLYHSGKGAPRILAEAARHYELAADYTHQPYPMLMLSVMYQEGRGVCHDMVKSVYWYKAASKQRGFHLAQYRIGRRYETGFALPKNYTEAYRWYLLAAQKGLALAQVELGDMYYAGRGLEQNDQDAFTWYYKAGRQGHSYAQNMVGLMLLEGKGAPKNPVLGSIWVRKAAYQGARQAQYQLGMMYLNGQGVPQDDVYAYGWLKVALEGVEDKTPLVITGLIHQMTPNLKERAVNLSLQFKQKYQSSGYTPGF